MDRFRFIIPILIAAGAFVTVSNHHASAAVPYTYHYNATNLYNSSDLTYEFSGLDTTITYLWFIWLVDDKTGERTHYIDIEIQAAGSATGSWSFGASTIDRWPVDYSGPVYVTDMLGNTLGKHFVTPSPLGLLEPYANPDWFATSGNTNVNAKQVIGPKSQGCDSPLYHGYAPIYAAINDDGWHHTFEPCTVLTEQGDYALLHFIADPAVYPSGAGDYLEIVHVGASAQVVKIALDDIVNYQVDSGYSGGVTYVDTMSYVILNTSGESLPFIDQTRANASFVTFDDPTTNIASAGVYELQRFSGIGPAWISDGESLWIVSDDPSGQELTLTAANDELKESGTQVLTARYYSETVWDDFHGTSEVSDLDAGYADTNVYAFTSGGIKHTYTVSSTTGTANPTWIVAAESLSENLATVLERAFVLSDTYTVIEVVTTEELITTVIGNTGLDNDLGRNGLLMIILFLSLVMVAFIPVLRRQPVAYLMSWTAAGGMFTVGGFATDLGIVTFAISTVALWLLAFTTTGLIRESDGD